MRRTLFVKQRREGARLKRPHFPRYKSTASCARGARDSPYRQGDVTRLLATYFCRWRPVRLRNAVVYQHVQRRRKSIMQFGVLSIREWSSFWFEKKTDTTTCVGPPFAGDRRNRHFTYVIRFNIKTAQHPAGCRGS